MHENAPADGATDTPTAATVTPSVAAPDQPSPWHMYAAVGVGGIIGAPLREIVELLIPSANSFPLATLAINWSGSFVLAWLYTITIWKWNMPQWLRTGIGTGVIGAFTTFSTFCVETDKLISTGRTGEALLYIALSLMGGFILGYLGSRLGGERVEPEVAAEEDSTPDDRASSEEEERTTQ